MSTARKDDAPRLSPAQALERVLEALAPVERAFVQMLRDGLTDPDPAIREAKADEIRASLADPALEIPEADAARVNAALDEAVEAGGREAHVQLILEVAERIPTGGASPSGDSAGRRAEPPIDPALEAELQAGTQFGPVEIPDISELIDG